MLDNIFVKILSETRTCEWMSLQKLHEILYDNIQEKAKAEQVMDFLKKYFIDVNRDKNLVRLNDWVRNLFEKLYDSL